MARVLIMLALGAFSFAAFMPGPQEGMPLADAAITSSPHHQLLASLDPISLAVGLIAGLVIGWVWRLPWGNLPELFRQLAVRSVRGFGLVGLAMIAAAFLLYY